MYLQKNQKVYEAYQYVPQPSFNVWLKLNQLDTVTTFLIYHSFGPTDTLSFKHLFTVVYDENCDEHYFELENIATSQHSLDSLIVSKSKYDPLCIDSVLVYY